MFNPPKAQGKVLPNEVVNMNSIRAIEKLIKEYQDHPEQFTPRAIAIAVYQIARGEREGN